MQRCLALSRRFRPVAVTSHLPATRAKISLATYGHGHDAPSQTENTHTNLSEISDDPSGSHFAQVKLKELLQQSLPDPSNLWGVYNEFCALHGPEKLSLRDHQQALRKCVPSTSDLRRMSLERLQEWTLTEVPHLWEHRFQTIIRRIRTAGFFPDVADYNFVLEQFTVTGHLHGAKAVFRELIWADLEPNYRTYGLCLQCIAHRLSLPCIPSDRSQLTWEGSNFCLEIIRTMTKRQKRCTSVNLDLCIRILKDTLSVSGFTKILKLGYGIDLEYPDRVSTSAFRLEVANDVTSPLELEGTSLIPFSSSALNTTINFLGKKRLLSQMVSAFETLTKPLPTLGGCQSGESNNNPRAFDEEEDEPSWLSAAGHVVPPAARPNVTTYNLLIKHSAKGGSFILTRHYILEAFEIDKQTDASLRIAIASMGIEHTHAPTFAVNRGTILPMLGFANRSKHLPLAKWAHRRCREVLDRKLAALKYFEGLAQSKESSVENHIENEATSALDSTALPISQKYLEPINWDLSAPPQPFFKPKPFDLDLHLAILRRDIEEISILSDRIGVAVERMSSRIRERLRRRVWNGRDIYLRSEDKRVKLPRNAWRQLSGPSYRTPVSSARKHHTRRNVHGLGYFSPSYNRGQRR